MQRLALLLFCLGLALSPLASTGLSVTNKQYQVKSLTTDGWNRVTVALFQVEFDGPLAVDSVPLSSLNLTDTSPYLDLALFDTTFPLSMSSAALVGIPSLQCPGKNNSFSSMPVDQIVTEEGVIPVPSTSDPVLAFFNSLMVPGADNFFAPMTVLDNVFSAILVLEDRRNCDPFAGCSLDTGLAPRLDGVNFSQCILSFGEGWSIDNQQGPVLHAANDGNDTFVGQQVTGFEVKAIPECNSADLDVAIANFQSATQLMSGKVFSTLKASFWRTMMFGIADPILSCHSLLSEYLNETTYSGMAPTDRCLDPDPQGSPDPCCNQTLRHESECCSERDELFSFPTSTISTTTRQLLKEAHCTERKIFLNALQDFLLSEVDNLNPLTGCSATAQAIASDAVFAAYYAFVPECREIAETALGPCTQNSDCLSDLCFSLQCQPAYDSGFGGLAHTLCFAEEMSSQVAAIVKVELGVPGANQSVFIEQMVEQLWNTRCNTHWFSPEMVITSTTAPFGFTVLDWTEEECYNYYVGCSYETFLDHQECLALPKQTDPTGVCALCYGEICSNVVFGPRCFYPNLDQGSCLYLGGVWDSTFGHDQPCTIPNIDNEQDCLLPDFCPPASYEETPDFYLKSRCAGWYCYSLHAFTEEDCLNISTCENPTFWDPTISNGVCKTSQGYYDCLVNGDYYWIGREWWDPLYATKDTCEAGMCGGGGYLYYGTKGANCTDSTCSQTCSICSSAPQNTLACVTPNITTECDCNIAGGSWYSSVDPPFCSMSITNKPDCVAQGYEAYQCEDLATIDECRACNSTFCQALQCYWEYRAQCRTEEQCSTHGGLCTDLAVASNTGECDSNLLNERPASCFTSCVVQPTLNSDGTLSCPVGVAYQSAGCVVTSIEDADNCTALGGRLYTQSWNEETCLGQGSACYEAEFSPYYSGKNETQCDTCAGDWESVFDWSPGQWFLETQFPLKWVPVELVPVLHYEPMMNYTKLEQVVTYVAVLQTTLSLQSEAQCLLNPMLSVLRLLACSCGANTDAEYKQYCETASGQIREISLGSSLLCHGVEDSVRNGGFVFLYRNDTIDEDYGCLQTSVFSIPVVQFASPQSSSLSALSLSNAAAHISKNPYAVLKNQYDRQIGQLIGNGIDLSFSLLSSSASEKQAKNEVNATTVTNSTTNTSSSILVHNLTVCFEKNSNVEHDANFFPVLDLAELIDGSWVVLEVQLNVSVLEDRTYFCTNLSEGGQYAPIYRVTDPNDPQNLFSNVELGFIYTLAALFLFGWVLCFILVILTLYIHGCRGFFVNLVKGKQLAAMILLLLLFFSGIRGIWLVLAGTEVVNNNSSLALDAVLTDLPIYIFFTLFMLLIFFWAELYHFQFKRKNSVLGKLKIPFVLVNLFIYIFFIVIVVVYSNTDASAQPTVDKVYKCIVAGIGFTILTLFLFYGGMLSFKSYHSRSSGSSTANRQFFRLSFITLTCSIASIIQFIFLLLFTFLDIENVVSILVYLFVVELIPFYLLLFLFFQPTNLNEALSSSYGSRPSNKRSLPGMSSKSTDSAIPLSPVASESSLAATPRGASTK